MQSLAMFLAVAIGAVAAVAAMQDANANPPAVTGDTATAPAEAGKSQITTVSGTVSAYEPGRQLTVLRPNATTVTYVIDGSSAIPSNLAKGRKVVVRTITRPGLDQPLVRKVTYSKTTKKTSTE